MKAEEIAREKLIDALGYNHFTELDNPALMLNAAVRIRRLGDKIKYLNEYLKKIEQELIKFTSEQK